VERRGENKNLRDISHNPNGRGDLSQRAVSFTHKASSGSDLSSFKEEGKHRKRN